MYKATIAIGKMRLEIETQSMKDVFKWSGVYATLPKKCDACGSDNLYLSYRSPKGNDYYSLRCGECSAEANFGQTKDGGNLYYKFDNKMQVYQG